MPDISKQDLIDLEDRIKHDLTGLEERITRQVDQRMEKLETKLLTAFHGWARSMEIRVRSLTSSTVGFDERLALVEERLSELERRIWRVDTLRTQKSDANPALART